MTAGVVNSANRQPWRIDHIEKAAYRWYRTTHELECRRTSDESKMYYRMLLY
jgi:hypothetical protein